MENIVGQVQMKKLLHNIENYNIIINSIKNILGDNYKEYINSNNCNISYGKKSIYDKIVKSSSTYYNGWFECINLTDTLIDQNTKKIFTFSDIKRIISNNYSKEYGECYNFGKLNEDKFIDLMVTIYKNITIKISNFSLDIKECMENEHANNQVSELLSHCYYDNRLKLCDKLYEENNQDLEKFNSIIEKLIMLKMELNTVDEDKSKVDLLISVLKKYNISHEKYEFLLQYIDYRFLSDIKYSMDNYDLVDISSYKENTKSKKMVLQTLF